MRPLQSVLALTGEGWMCCWRWLEVRETVSHKITAATPLVPQVAMQPGEQSHASRPSSQRCSSKIHRLETFLRMAQGQYSLLRTQYQQLREDFRFNLNVLEERDRELHRYDLLTSGDSCCKSQQSGKKWDLQHSIQELRGPQPTHSEAETSEEVFQKTKTQLRIKENTSLECVEAQRFVNVDRAQTCMDQNHKELLEEMHRAMTKLQSDLDTLSAQAWSMRTQHEEQLQEREETIDRYRKQLSTSLEQEKHLEQKMMQIELEWQKNCEDIRSKHYLDNERLIQELSLAREKANAELVEMKEQLQELTVLLQCVTKERDLALQGCIPDTGSLASEELAALQQQNRRLQAVVSQMRKQMEELSRTTPLLQHHRANCDNKEVNALKKEDVQHLEPNILSVKEKVLNYLVCSCGHVSSFNTTVAHLYSRLKQAASCIARLNRDRQQLIELCNRLQAQICSDELHCPRKDLLKTEENCDCESEKQEPLTTQILPRGCPGVLQAHRLSEESLPSLSALWALLDQGPLQDLAAEPSEGPSEDTPADPSEQVPSGGQMEVRGLSASLHSQSTAKAPQRRGQLKHTGRSTAAKIRNYNIKD